MTDERLLHHASADGACKSEGSLAREQDLEEAKSRFIEEADRQGYDEGGEGVWESWTRGDYGLENFRGALRTAAEDYLAALDADGEEGGLKPHERTSAKPVAAQDDPEPDVSLEEALDNRVIFLRDADRIERAERLLFTLSNTEPDKFCPDHLRRLVAEASAILGGRSEAM